MMETPEQHCELVAREEAKRLRNWDPVARWKAWLAAVAWAEAQRPVRRNSKAGCLADQRRKMEASSSQTTDTQPPQAR